MKILKTLAGNYDLELIDEQLSFLETMEAVKGKIKDYYVSVLVDLRDYIVKVNIDEKTDRSKINSLLDELKKEFSGIKKAEVKKNYIEVIVDEGKSKKLYEDIESILNKITDFLEKEETVSCCAFCGASPEEADIKATQVIKNESEIDYICENCHKTRLEELEKNKEEMTSKKENHILGALGYLGAVAVVVILFGGIAGYTFFTKKMGAMGSALFVLASSIVIATSHFITVVFHFRDGLRAEGVSSSFFEAA